MPHGNVPSKLGHAVEQLSRSEESSCPEVKMSGN